MKVLRSKVLGYCFGVANTIEKAHACTVNARQKGCPCYSIGNLIHNEDVVRRFESQGLVSIKSPEGITPGIALIRAHGIPDRDRRAFQQLGFELVDSTCPIVAKGAQTIRNAALKGRRTIVLGVKDHAETLGLLGVETPDCKAVPSILLCSLSDAVYLVEHGNLDKNEDIVVITQTTFKLSEYNEIKKFLKENFENIRFSNQPCGASKTRIDAVTELSKSCDAVVVVGGKQSENTKGLAMVAMELGKPVFQILNEKDIDAAMINDLKKYSTVGLCSGSSTPTYVIKAVEDTLAKI